MIQAEQKVRPGQDEIRAQFPALESQTIFLENAGGSQVPRGVIDAISAYLMESNVQLGAGYSRSQAATAQYAKARAFVNDCLMNGQGVGQTIFGPSSSALCRMLADAYADILRPGDEVIVCETAHEANYGPWLRLEELGVVIKNWKVEPDGTCPLEQLAGLLSEQTKIVAFPHVSNLLGEIVDVQAIAKMAHEVGARVVVDGVAFAPHRAIDVKAWGVDWYVYSTYKVFGPHMAALFGRDEALRELTGPNHFFIDKDYIGKFELGCVAHELAAGVLALGPYLSFLAGAGKNDRDTVERAYRVVTDIELPLQRRLIDFLRSKPDVRIIGPAHAEASRVPTISFVHRRLSPPEICAVTDCREIGIRYGHMYAYRLCQSLGLDPETGVVRISAVHYNTPAEIEALIDVLDGIL